MNIKFESLLEDESFVEKVLREDSESEEYIESLLKSYPEKKEEILYAVQFLKFSNVDRKKLSRTDASNIWEDIQNKQKTYSIKNQLFSKAWRVAAVALILVGIGYYTYIQYQTNIYKRVAQNAEVINNEAMLILSNGSEYKLENNGSKIRYDSNGEKIVISETGSQTEQIENTKKTQEEVLNQIIVPFGRRHSITLSDGTVVQLNSGSKLIYPAYFRGKTRKVYLKGEGYFDVAKNKNIPFVVNTDYIDIRVTGTVFNVSAYEDEQTASAVLVEGSVEVSQKNRLFNNQKYTLQPGQGCFYSVKTAQSNVNNVDTINYIGWKDGWLQFKNQPLINIVRKIEKYYNKDILIEGEKLAQTLISGKLVLSDQFEEAMSYLTKTLEGRYERNDKEIYIIKQ